MAVTYVQKNVLKYEKNYSHLQNLLLYNNIPLSFTHIGTLSPLTPSLSLARFINIYDLVVSKG